MLTSRCALAVTLAAIASVPIACKKFAPPAGGGRGGPVPVAAVKAVVKAMPVVLRAIGNVRASVTVSVKPRVGGMIAEVNFQEGQEVKAGDVLFTIDAKLYEVALAQANAALAQVREGAQQQAQRYSSLGKSGAVAKEQLEQVASTAKASTAGAEAAEAAVKEAQIQLGYTSIKSPITGRTGRRMIDAGNVVVANTTELVIVNQLAPIDVLFKSTRAGAQRDQPLQRRAQAARLGDAPGKRRPRRGRRADFRGQHGEAGERHDRREGDLSERRILALARAVR